VPYRSLLIPPLVDRRIDGTRRWTDGRPPKKKKPKSGPTGTDRFASTTPQKGQQALRIKEHADRYAEGLDVSDKQVRAKVRHAAVLAVELDAVCREVSEGKRSRRSARLPTLFRAHAQAERAVERLRQKPEKAKPEPEPVAPAKGTGGWPNAVARYLHFLRWALDRVGGESIPANRRAELEAEYARIEATGAFVGAKINGYHCGPAP
jgi:hypothetical protein